MENRLTDRQRRFVEHYLECGNAVKAAVAAGFCKEYAQTVKRNPAVLAALEEHRAQMPVRSAEVMNFLTGVMRGNIKASDLRTEAAYQVGLRAGMWKNRTQYEKMIKEAAANE